ncbi:hypothetical protein PspLS_09833, partial [Pyricularia sp. CBS 133598]
MIFNDSTGKQALLARARQNSIAMLILILNHTLERDHRNLDYGRCLPKFHPESLWLRKSATARLGSTPRPTTFIMHSNALQLHLEKRNAVIKNVEPRGEETPHDDANEWCNREIKGDKKPDRASAQISLSLVAIHTTSDLLMQTMVNIAITPKLFTPLRQGVIEIPGTRGAWVFNPALL